jgi:PTS system mannose-specific IID component
MNKAAVLTKKDLNRCGRRWWMAVCTFNYETQLAASAVFAESKALRKIYPDDEEYKAALNNQFKYFNTMPYLCNLLLGAGIAMEDADGIDTLDAVQSLKVGLMGPLAGIGDSLGWILLPTIFGSIAGYMGKNGNPIGLIIWSIVYALLFIWRSTWWNYGYKMGSNFITNMGNQLNAFTEAASILGLTVVGAMIPTIVSLNTGLIFKYGDVKLDVQTDVLDAIFPSLLSVLATLLVYKLLKKGVKMTYIIIGILVIGCIGAATGILR